MLEIKSITWRNFMSYGDYESHIELSDLGQCLITGHIEDDSEAKSRSNGAGKSTIPNVLQWVLFGRTMHSHNPGDNVVNYHTGKDCWARVEFKNGDFIIRTRKVSGENELIFGQSGDEVKFTSDTLSTSKNQQLMLNKKFGLDYELFCASVFFNQYSKPWMEMADATRRKALERVLHVDRFTSYATVAKKKVDMTDQSVTVLRNEIERDKKRIETVAAEIAEARQNQEEFEQSREKKRKGLLDQAQAEEEALAKIVIPDVEKLRALWDLIAKVEKKINKMRDDFNGLVTKQSQKIGEAQTIKRQLDEWRAKEGKVCTSCSQSIDAGHVCTKIDPIIKRQDELAAEIADLKAQSDETNAKIVSAKSALEDKKPKMTVRDAESIINDVSRRKKRITDLKNDADNVLSEKNAYVDIIEKYQKASQTLTDGIEKKENQITELNLIQQHYQYIYKSYNDRNKIKGYVFKEHVPFINERLKYYLDVFGLDVKINLTESLSIESNAWGYDFQSGGERKRTDVAFMLATFDFHERMYGRQCNIMVLDEVDGRMDDDGIDALIGIIKGELASKVETVLVISHRDMMFDTFDKEVKVVRKDRYSYLEVT